MFIEEFKYDADSASVIKEEKRVDANDNTVVRITFENGVIIVFTQTPNGYKRIDTNFVLIKQADGYYKSDLSSPKKDFHDYY